MSTIVEHPETNEFDVEKSAMEQQGRVIETLTRYQDNSTKELKRVADRDAAFNQAVREEAAKLAKAQIEQLKNDFEEREHQMKRAAEEEKNLALKRQQNQIDLVSHDLSNEKAARAAVERREKVEIEGAIQRTTDRLTAEFQKKAFEQVHRHEIELNQVRMDASIAESKANDRIGVAERKMGLAITQLQLVELSVEAKLAEQKEKHDAEMKQLEIKHSKALISLNGTHRAENAGYENRIHTMETEHAMAIEQWKMKVERARADAKAEFMEFLSKK